MQPVPCAKLGLLPECTGRSFRNSRKGGSRASSIMSDSLDCQQSLFMQHPRLSPSRPFTHSLIGDTFLQSSVQVQMTKFLQPFIAGSVFRGPYSFFMVAHGKKFLLCPFCILANKPSLGLLLPNFLILCLASSILQNTLKSCSG